MKPKVSILIPVFNRERFIAECIQSAIDQTFTDLEVVIVDNASDDGTWEICERYAVQDPRVRIFRNETNIGPVRNWKRCAEEAVGEFSKILFSDDILEPDCLAEMVPKLEDPDVSFVYCAARIGTCRKEATTAYSLSATASLSSTRYRDLVLRGKAPVSPGAVLIRTKDLLANLHTDFPTITPRPFDKHGAGPDVMIMLLTAENYQHVVHEHIPLVYFRAHAGSFSVGNERNLVWEGYVSAISYYLSKSGNRRIFIKYQAVTWLQKMRRLGGYQNPRKYLLEYEGAGDFAELMLMMTYSVMYISSRILDWFFHKAWSLFKNSQSLIR